MISHGANAPVPLERRYGIEFFWTGTNDFTPALAGCRLVADALGAERPCPDAMVGAMASLPVRELPRFGAPEAVSALALDPLQDALLRDHRIGVPVLSCPRTQGACCGSPRRRTMCPATTSGSRRRCAS